MRDVDLITLRLPYPPSANAIWRNVRGRTLKSSAYRAWLKSVAVAALQGRPGRVAGRYTLEVTATPPDRRARDIDNLLKPVSDALMAAGVIGDDSAARSVFAEWSGQTVKPGFIDVTVRRAA